MAQARTKKADTGIRKNALRGELITNFHSWLGAKNTKILDKIRNTNSHTTCKNQKSKKHKAFAKRKNISSSRSQRTDTTIGISPIANCLRRIDLCYMSNTFYTKSTEVARSNSVRHSANIRMHSCRSRHTIQ